MGKIQRDTIEDWKKTDPDDGAKEKWLPVDYWCPLQYVLDALEIRFP